MNCKNCSHFSPSSVEYLAKHKLPVGGECQNDKFITEDYGNNSYTEMSLVYSYNEGGHFWVGANFGCIHFSATGDSK